IGGCGGPPGPTGFGPPYPPPPDQSVTATSFSHSSARALGQRNYLLSTPTATTRVRHACTFAAMSGPASAGMNTVHVWATTTRARAGAERDTTSESCNLKARRPLTHVFTELTTLSNQ